MAELIFNAAQHPQPDVEQQPIPPLEWDNQAQEPELDYRDAYKRQYQSWLDECAAKRDKVARLTAEWRKSVEASHEAKMYALVKRRELNEAKSEQIPPAPIKNGW